MRELRQHASRYLARVRRGESLRITDRGRPVALLVPVGESRRDELVRRGLLRPGTGHVLDVEPVELPGGPALSEVLAEMRADER